MLLVRLARGPLCHLPKASCQGGRLCSAGSPNQQFGTMANSHFPHTAWIGCFVFLNDGDGRSWTRDQRITKEGHKRHGMRGGGGWSIKRHWDWLWDLSGFCSAWRATLQGSLWNWRRVQLHPGFLIPRLHVSSSHHHNWSIQSSLSCMVRCMSQRQSQMSQQIQFCWTSHSSLSYFPMNSWCCRPSPSSRHHSRGSAVYFLWVPGMNRKFQTGK